MVTVALVYPHIDGTDGYALDFARLRQELESTPIDVLTVKYSSSNGGIGARLGLLNGLKHSHGEIDVIHFVGFFFPEYLLAAHSATADGIPYVISPLSNLQRHALERSRRKKRVFLMLGGARFLRRANAVHSFGSSETESILDLGFRGDIFEIPLGLDLESRDSASLEGQDSGELHNLNAAKDYVLFFGRLDVFQKGLDLLLEGFEIYCKSNPSGLRLVIAGRSWNGSDQWLRSRIATMACADRIAYAGETSDQTKFDLMQNARALIYPSRFDGPPRPLRDAIASGVFVLASRQSNIYPDLERHGLGFFFDANRVGVAGAIKAVTGEVSPPVSGLGRSLLNWKATATQYADMYRSMVNHRA